jgi:hypothetical protein
MKGVPVQMIALCDLEANPYRHMERYVISEDRVAALEQSYQNSGFWNGSLQARPHPTRNGKYQLAFGHHRLEAARRQQLDAVGVVVARRSNADMLRMMADENRAEFKHDALVGVETIAAVVEAYQRGEVELGGVPEQTEKAYIYALPGGRAYSLATVARFLGWVKPSDGQATSACRTAFDAFRERASTEEALLTLAPTQRSEVAVETVVSAAKAARVQAQRVGLAPAKVRQAERHAAHAAAREVRETSGFRARNEAAKMGADAVKAVTGPKTKALPLVEVYTDKLIRKVEVADPYAVILTECRRLIPFVDDLSPMLMKRLAKALREMLDRSSTGVDFVVRALEAGKAQSFVALLKQGQ